MESTNPNKNKQEIKILAGRMPLHDGKIKPDPSKGEIRIFSKDNLLQFQWTNLDKNLSDDPLVVFSGEWEWVKIPSNKGRVYVMKSKCFEDAQYYFWMQSPNKEDDIENEKLLNQIFESGVFSIENKSNNLNSEKNDDKEITGLNNFETISTGNTDQSQKMSNEDFIKNMASTFKNIKQKYPKLGKILNKNNINKIIDDENINDLLKYLFLILYRLLPDNQQTKEDFFKNVSSPQFQQALESLSESFGLDLSLANTSINGVEVFIKCLVKKYSKKIEKN